MLTPRIPLLLLLLLSLLTYVIATPNRVEKRQDVSQLLQLASQAGVSLPTDAAALLRLGPIAQQLASALPTAPVLSVLQTAAPSGFISQVVHDPAYASSFVQAFSAGSSPSWFNALPTEVKSYLHTYTNYGGVATAVGQVESVKANVSAGMTASSGSTAMSSMSVTGSMSASASASASAARASSTSSAGAPSQTGVLAMGILGAAGVLGLAVAL